jgi:hypothetical protein
VTDFGLAKRTGDYEGGADQDLSQTGALLGTPSYMAPEQAEGKGEVGPAADVYALGVILYELLTGRPPFKGATLFDTLDQVRSQEPVPPTRLARVPVDLETICLKCLSKAPKQRYGSAAELGDNLNRFLRGEPVRARPLRNAARAWRWCLRNKRLATALLAVVVSLVGGTIVSISYAIQADLSATDAHAKKRLADEKEELANQKREEAVAQFNRAEGEKAEAQRQKKLAEDETNLKIAEAKAKEIALGEKVKALYQAQTSLIYLQMKRVSAPWEREPTLACSFLDDETFCPRERRDLPWHLFRQASAYEIFSDLEGSHRASSNKSVCFSADGQTLFVAHVGRIWGLRRRFLRTAVCAPAAPLSSPWISTRARTRLCFQARQLPAWPSARMARPRSSASCCNPRSMLWTLSRAKSV